jgi:hypothetical protein
LQVAALHVPLRQVEVPFGTAHLLPQVPQLFTSEVTSVVQPREFGLQAPKPELQLGEHLPD